MEYQATAYLAYGVEIPHITAQTAEEKLGGHTVGVGCLYAGTEHDQKTYLVTACEIADLGKPKSIDLSYFAEKDLVGPWNQMLDHAAGKVGVEPLGEPGWLLIADVS